MEEVKDNKRIWKFLYTVAHNFVLHRFNMKAEPCRIDGPCLIISNHVTTWDPLLLAMSFRDNPINFVASEHIFRNGFISKVLEKLVAPIPRRKATTGSDTVKACLRRLKEGAAVCIFAEGDATWDGITHDIFPATGKLARLGNATLVTYRLEGGYLSLPRWSKKLRRGLMRGGPVGIYPPEQLRKMKPEEIDELINRDIFEDAWERQRNEQIEYKGKNIAEGIEQAYFVCPKCGRIGTVKGVGDHIVCDCGFDVLYTAKGFLEPAEPFETLAQWDKWQHEKLREMTGEADGMLFSDAGLTLTEIGAGHSEQILSRGELCQYTDSISCGDMSFMLSDISNMAMVKSNILLLSSREHYYEIRASKPCCLRKYLAVWNNR